jgi:uncharacterized lipoprotein
MKASKLLLASSLIVLMMAACNNSSTTSETVNGNDTSSTNPTTNAQDYHPDQRQEIPLPDSSNTIGTDTINGAEATPNTGTQKSYNTTKGTKDSSEKQ